MLANALPTLFEHLEQQLSQTDGELRRLFHGRGRCYEGLEQITCDWVARHLLVTLFKPVDELFAAQLKQGLLTLTHGSNWQTAEGKGITLQYRYEEGAPFETISGEMEHHPIVNESGINYKLDIGRNQNFGLFLDMKNGRDWVREHAKGKSVLNLFAYTCGFSVAAITGGATHVVNVDMARSSLSKGRDNHRLNDHDLRSVSFLSHDIFKSWGKISKAGPYDLIVIDPPSFQKGSFALTKDYKKILRRLPDLLAEGGEVMACVNSPAVSPNFLVESMEEEAPQLQFRYRLNNLPEFRDVDESLSLKVMIFS